MPQVHIYPLSRLVHASASNWERVLSSIEEGKTRAFSYYLPMREAVVRFCETRGADRDTIIADMIARARQMGGARGPRIAKANQEAFEAFEATFFPQISEYRRHFLRDQQSGCQYAGLTLIGAPHVQVTDSKGRERYAFLHASDWKSNDLAAYLELLGVIVQKSFGADPASLWVWDLKRGKEIKWRPSSRVRRRCEGAARLYARLIRALEE